MWKIIALAKIRIYVAAKVDKGNNFIIEFQELLSYINISHYSERNLYIL